MVISMVVVDGSAKGQIVVFPNGKLSAELAAAGYRVFRYIMMGHVLYALSCDPLEPRLDDMWEAFASDTGKTCSVRIATAQGVDLPWR